MTNGVGVDYAFEVIGLPSTMKRRSKWHVVAAWPSWSVSAGWMNVSL